MHSLFDHVQMLLLLSGIARHNAEFFDTSACTHGATTVLEIQNILRKVESAKSLKNNDNSFDVLSALWCSQKHCPFYVSVARYIYLDHAGAYLLRTRVVKFRACFIQRQRVTISEMMRGSTLGSESSVQLVDVLKQLSASLHTVLPKFRNWASCKPGTCVRNVCETLGYAPHVVLHLLQQCLVVLGAFANSRAT